MPWFDCCVPFPKAPVYPAPISPVELIFVSLPMEICAVTCRAITPTTAKVTKTRRRIDPCAVNISAFLHRLDGGVLPQLLVKSCAKLLGLFLLHIYHQRAFYFREWSSSGWCAS